MKALRHLFVAAGTESVPALASTALNGVGCLPVTNSATFPKGAASLTVTEPCYSP